jgi:SAM-dependent methyltransferase
MLVKDITKLRELLTYTQHQMGSEVQAGGRSLLAPSPIHDALSSLRGRMMARMINMLGYPKSAQNFTISRNPVLEHLIKAHLKTQAPVIIDPFAGFSPIGYNLARYYPQGKHYDLASIFLKREIEARYRKAVGVTLPANYHLLTVNYNNGELETRFGGQVDAIIANSSYFEWEDNIAVLRYLRDLLRPDGVLITSIVYSPGVEDIREALRFFSSQIGHFPINITHNRQVTDFMQQSGLHDIRTIRASELVDTLNLPQPIKDLEVFSVGRR